MLGKVKPVIECKTVEELFARKDRWTQWAWARDKNNKPLYFNHPDGEKFCLRGAISLIYKGEERINIYNKVYTSVCDSHGSVEVFNDNNDYKTILNLVKKLKI